MLRTILERIGRDRDRVVYECRHCGATVGGPGEQCPDCGAAEVARFVL